MLARPERRGRTLRSLAIAARFVAGGTWRTRVTLRQASADIERLRITLAPRLAELPAPAESLGLEVEAFGPPAYDQGRLVEGRLDSGARRARIAVEKRHPFWIRPRERMVVRAPAPLFPVPVEHR